MEITNEDRAILNHVVIDADEWISHALATVGEWAVIEKINRYRSDYLAQKDKPGYQTRAEREDSSNIVI